MAVPLDTRDDIRTLDARGVPRAEIARELGLSRNTVAKYADMEDLSPAPPIPARRPRPAVDAHAAWIRGVLEADLGAPRKQRHTAVFSQASVSGMCTHFFRVRARNFCGFAHGPADPDSNLLERDLAAAEVQRRRGLGRP